MEYLLIHYSFKIPLAVPQKQPIISKVIKTLVHAYVYESIFSVYIKLCLKIWIPL